MGAHDNENLGSTDKTAAAFGSVGIGESNRTAAAEPLQTQPRRAAAIDTTAANLGSRFKRAFTGTEGNQTVKDFVEAFTEVAKDALKPAEGVQYKLSSIDDTDTPDAPVGSVLIAAYFEAGDGKKVALVYTLPVDASVPSMATRPYEIPGTNRVINVQVPVSTYVNDTYWSLIVDKLSNELGAAYEFVAVGSFDLPRSLNPQRDTAQIRESARVAFGAIDTYLERHYVADPAFLTVKDITNRATTSIAMDLDDKPGIGPTGLPIRKDLTLSLRAAVRSAIQGMPDKTVDVVKAGCFLNLAYYMPPQPVSRDQRPDTRRFIPQIVLTELVPSREANIITPETQLAALATVPNLAMNDQWMAPLLPTATEGNPGRDFGAVGYEVNLTGTDNAQPVGKEDMTKMSTADQLEMIRMSVFTDELRVAVLVDDSAPYGWINALFRDAANPANTNAYDEVVRSANNLTGGVFGKIWQTLGSPAISRLTDLVLHTGYYTDPDTGEIRDLLDIDYLWMLNRGAAQNIDRVYAFGDTLLGTGDPIERLSQRWDIITKLVPSAVMTGNAQVVELSPEFLQTLVAAVKEAGLNMRPSNSLVDFTNAAGRASYSGGIGHGLNARAIAETLNSGYGSDQRRSGPSMFGGGLNSNWNRR